MAHLYFLGHLMLLFGEDIADPTACQCMSVSCGEPVTRGRYAQEGSFKMFFHNSILLVFLLEYEEYSPQRLMSLRTSRALSRSFADLANYCTWRVSPPCHVGIGRVRTTSTAVQFFFRALNGNTANRATDMTIVVIHLKVREIFRHVPEVLNKV